MTDKNLLKILIEARESINLLSAVLGHKMFDIFTRVGYPPEMAFDWINKNYKLTMNEKINIVCLYQWHKIKHDIVSGISEHRLEKRKLSNKKNILNFIKTGQLETI